MAPAAQRPHQRRMLALTVQANEQVSPHFQRVSLGGGDVQYLEQSGFDQSGRLFFADPGNDDVVLPTSERWMLQHTLTSGRRRPRVRTYSIARYHPGQPAFDLEICLHEQDGPAAPGTAWALAAQPGDQVAVLDEGYSYQPAAGTEWQLLIGDESALPAILAILADSTDALPTEVFLEVPTDEDIRHDVSTSAQTTIHWLPRSNSAETTVKPGSLALQASKNARLPQGPFYTWAAGEAALVTGIRRHLVGERGVDRSAISFRGYWRHGRAAL
ncbi:siderophore-interacting protein [Stenotrophomonas sp. NPDC087984]